MATQKTLTTSRIPTPDQHNDDAKRYADYRSEPPPPPGRGWDYEQYIDALTQRRERSEDDAWDSGDCLIDLFGDQKPKAGRPPTIDPQITLSDIARDTLIPRQRLGERLTLSSFYPPDARRFDRGAISITHYEYAMKHAKTQEEALAKLKEAERLHLSTRQFQRWLRGYWGEAPIPVEWLDPRVRRALTIPDGEPTVWLISSKPKD